jgi:hypothetical protein
VSSSDSDVGRHVIIRNVLESVFNILRYSQSSGESKHAYTGLLFRKVSYIIRIYT